MQQGTTGDIEGEGPPLSQLNRKSHLFPASSLQGVCETDNHAPHRGRRVPFGEPMHIGYSVVRFHACNEVGLSLDIDGVPKKGLVDVRARAKMSEPRKVGEGLAAGDCNVVFTPSLDIAIAYTDDGSVLRPVGLNTARQVKMDQTQVSHWPPRW